MVEVRYDDMIGFKIFKIHEFLLKVIGVRTDVSSGNDPVSLTMAQCFGYFMSLLAALQGLATVLAVNDCLIEEDYETVSIVMAYVSVMVSALSKYYILRKKSDALHRLGAWMIQARSARSDAKFSDIELLGHRMNMSLYFFFTGASIFWMSMPLMNNLTPYIPSKVPFLDGKTTDAISYPFVQVPTILMATSVVSYTAASIIHTMVVFCTEVRLLGNKWTTVVYDKDHPEHFVTVMKDCVNHHEKLLKVMEDLSYVFDSMFGFQVLFFIAHICAFNFCLLKMTGMEGVAPLLPLMCMSTMELGSLCYVSEEITDAFEQFYRQIYDTNWYESRVSDKRCMIIVLENFKKRRFLTGATVVPATLSTFVEALRHAFSLYTLLEALTTDE